MNGYKGLSIPESNISQDQEIKDLAVKLQCFPLAIQQAIAYIEDQRVTGEFGISDYLKEYEKKTGVLLNSKVFQGIDNDYARTTFTTWQITIDKIRSNEQYGQLALNILDTMAYFAPEDIKREMFSNLADGDEEQLKSAVRLLVKYSMVNGGEKQSVLNIHRLVQEVIKLELKGQNQEEEILRKALELVNGADVAEESVSHVTSVWGHVSRYGKLIDDFYFNHGFYGEQKSTPLHLLAENGDYKAIKAILTHIEKKHSDKLSKVVNAKDDDYSTPLHSAAESGNLDVVEYLVGKGADVNVNAKEGTPLHWAAQSGNLDVVEYLVGKGADVNVNAKEGTPLHEAVKSGNLDVVEYLVAKGADVNAKDDYDRTPLHWAAERGEWDVIKYLMGKGADVNANANTQEFFKPHYSGTPLHSAAGSYFVKLDVVKYLVEKGADVNAKAKGAFYGTPLHRAAESGSLDVVEYLVGKGVDVNLRTTITVLRYTGLLRVVNWM